VGRVIHAIESIADEVLRGEDVSLQIGGRAKMVHAQVESIVQGQIDSILLSIAGVFLITSLMFRSGIAGILNILPIAVASLWNFGFMRIFGLALEPGSAITSCIGIGVGIDYSIHFISKYRFLCREAREEDFPDAGPGPVYQELTVRTMETAGKAIAFNAFVVIFGFLVLLFSNFPPTRNMGILVSINMFTCFLGALTLLPAVLNGIRPRACRVSWASGRFAAQK
jgi:predicted RND superfamily exporter protein